MKRKSTWDVDKWWTIVEIDDDRRGENYLILAQRGSTWDLSELCNIVEIF